MVEASKPIKYLEIDATGSKTEDAEVITETPVALTVNGEVWLTFMCTPTDLEAMAVGFLFNEGVIKSMQEVAQVRLCDAGDNVDVWLEHNAEKPDRWQRTSGCTGGVTSVDMLHLTASEGSQNGYILSARKVSKLLIELLNAQDLYRRSGGVHTSFLSDGKKVLIVTEDIGRHNTLDKIAGLYLMKNLQMEHRIILTTGRISSEMLQKAARMGVSVLISRTSPSSLSIEMAERLGITLIGYARRDNFRIYTHPQRISFTVKGVTRSAVIR